MRLPESQVKQGIVHPGEEVRLTALRYFADAHSQDPSIMPWVIRAVEEHGRDSAFSLLRTADQLPQTEVTVDWLVRELRQDFDLDDVGQDNYRYAVALVLCQTHPELLEPRQTEILALPAFPESLHQAFCERIEMLRWDWESAWAALEDFDTDAIDCFELLQSDPQRARRITECLARHGAQGADRVLQWL